MIRLVILFVLSLLLALPAAAQNQETGYHAYARRDYETARAHFGPLAERGGRVSQIYLGLMLYRGWGVPLDRTEGLKWATIADHRRTLKTMLVEMTRAEIREARQRARDWELRVLGFTKIKPRPPQPPGPKPKRYRMPAQKKD